MKKLVLVSLFILFKTTLSFTLSLNEPINDARFGRHDAPPVFTWNDETDSDTYFVEFSADPSFSLAVALKVQSKQLDLNNLIDLNVWTHAAFKMYWRVREKNGGTSNSRFFTKTALFAPRFELPFDSRFDRNDLAPDIIWDEVGGAEFYRGEISESGNFLKYGIQFDWISNHINLAEEIPNAVWENYSGMFYLRIWGVDNQGRNGPYQHSIRISKTTLDPTIIIEPSGTRFSARSFPASFICKPVHGASGYQFQIAESGNWQFNSSIYYSISNILDLENVLPQEEWEYMHGSYRWRVAVIDACGAFGKWSDDGLFYKCGRRVITGLGDSITTGNVCIKPSWLDFMHEELNRNFDHFDMYNAAVGGTKAKWGAEVIRDVLEFTLPEYILILFGANDSVDPGNCDPPYGCDVSGHLREMVYISREYGVTPIIATVLPVNPEGDFAYHQFRVDMYNENIRQMAWEEHVQLVDLNAAAWNYGYVPDLYCDWGHPNYLGTQLIADQFYDAVIINE